jgi:hypothetical protein
MTNVSTRRILIVGTDGLRPDQFDPDLMPAFNQLRQQGVTVENYHAVYPTHTRVNLSTLTTGCTPGKHGIVANVFRHAGATDDGIINTSDYRHLQALDHYCNGDGVAVPTLGDIIDARGKRLAVASTSSSGAGIIWNRNFPYRIVNTNSTYGRADLYSLRDKVGEVPDPGTPPKLDHVNYAARAVTDIFLDDEEIEIIVLWFAEPDSSLHYYGVGAPETRAAMKGCDDALAFVIEAMERRGVRDQFDIIHLSDHGHSTVDARRTLAEHLDRARNSVPDFPALLTASDFIYKDPAAGPVSKDEVCRVVDWLQNQPWAGAIFASDEIAEFAGGVFPFSSVWGSPVTDRAPLLGVSPAWSDSPNTFGVSGTVAAMTEHAALRSTHGSTSPYELHAVAVLSGPDFQNGTKSQVPAGATDIAPTLLHLLGEPVPEWMDGRVLYETLSRPAGEAGDVNEVAFEPDRAGSQGFRPVVHMHQVGETRYLNYVENGGGRFS